MVFAMVLLIRECTRRLTAEMRQMQVHKERMLAVITGRPVDRIVQNAGGAWATRDQLARELARGSDRLAQKRLVIFQFAERELASGDWRPVELSR